MVQINYLHQFGGQTPNALSFRLCRTYTFAASRCVLLTSLLRLYKSMSKTAYDRALSRPRVVFSWLGGRPGSHK